MEQTMPTNRVLLQGQLLTLPVFSHENHGKTFDRFQLEIQRLSGTRDQVDVLTQRENLEIVQPEIGDLLHIEGQLRSYNNRSGQGRRLVISVYGQQVQQVQGQPENQVWLQGRVCREPVYRRTPLGREICDVMLAVERRYGRKDYIPCILWGSLARMAAECPKGSFLWLQGRLQSRTYVKQLEFGSEERTAFEVSAITAGRLD
jgi:single-stranded DNA-binding protein